jgi:hypothetical protein
MKIRNGFVSNSSSSSFTVIMSGEQEKIWLDQLSHYEKQAAKIVERVERDFNGQKVVVYSGYSGNYDIFEDEDIELLPEDKDLDEEELGDKYDCEFYPSEFWYEATGKLPEGVLQLSVNF